MKKKFDDYRVIDSVGNVMLRTNHFDAALNFYLGIPSGCRIQQVQEVSGNELHTWFDWVDITRETRLKLGS